MSNYLIDANLKKRIKRDDASIVLILLDRIKLQTY